MLHLRANRRVVCHVFTVLFTLANGYIHDAEELFTACVDSDQGPVCRVLGNETLVCTDTIPVDPMGYEDVVIKWCSARNGEESLFLEEESFKNSNWTVVREFTYIKSQNIAFHTIIEPFAFKPMERLEMVRLHVLKSQLLLNVESFCGVETLRSLNFSGSAYLQQYFISKILFLEKCLPNLEELSLSGISLHHDLDFNEEFLSYIFRRPIRVLDLRFLHVRNLNITTVTKNCTYLEYLYLSDTMFESVDHGLPNERVCPKLKLVDVSGAQFVFMKLLCMVRNLGYVSTTVKVEGDYRFLLDTETLFWDRLCPQSFDITSAINIRSAKLALETPKRLKQLYVRNNYFNKFDAEINWESSNIEHLDLSNNSIALLNLGFFTFGDKIRNVSLSGNRLYLMVDQSATEFENMFSPLRELRYLSLARNNLTTLPKYSFHYNTKLEVLDLSQNRLSTISFSYELIGNLTLLNLSGNMIDFKDLFSIEFLNYRVGFFNVHNGKWLDISKNPLTCNQANDLEFVNWLLKSNRSFYNWHETKCIYENGSLIPINRDALCLVEEICERPKKQQNLMIFSAIVAILIPVCLYQCKNYFRQKRLDRTEEDRSDLLQQNAEGSEFAVFLSYSSDDKDFVKEYVYDQLNDALQARLNVNRELVFFSEMHMRAGMAIKDGIRDALSRSAVLLFILSDSTVDSEWCIFEFHEALGADKPIVLMLKDTVDETRLPENIKTFFMTNTRIIWQTDENGDYSLETSWQNVCSSILSTT